jgi:transcriptional regulator with XRE-family HTH domain
VPIPSIATELRVRRQALGLSQAALARALGVAVQLNDTLDGFSGPFKTDFVGPDGQALASTGGTVQLMKTRSSLRSSAIARAAAPPDFGLGAFMHYGPRSGSRPPNCASIQPPPAHPVA